MLKDIQELDLEERLQLVQLACLAAWADLIVVPEERQVVFELANHLAFGEEQLEEVSQWLTGPPPEIDPGTLPLEHRQLFLDALLEVVLADGRLEPEESEMLTLLRELLLAPG